LPWVLIDTAWANCSGLIQQAAEWLFGLNASPAGILLTHDHPDHAGSALNLARRWGCPAYVHPNELALATASELSTVEQYANPLDRWLILPSLRAMGRQRAEAMLAKSSLADVAWAFDPEAPPSDLPDWACIPTPGHSPGHVAFFRENDRVLTTGDALLTLDLESTVRILHWRLGVARPLLPGGDAAGSFQPGLQVQWDTRLVSPATRLIMFSGYRGDCARSRGMMRS
jgi:glyoxylase-like metal-dependent hydrolase (beta-lactamase superfamily II)